MKNSKRILGVVLALIMIFNVFAVGTFAAFPDDTAVKLGVSTDKKTYAPGETIVLTISQQVLEEIGQMRVSGCYVLSFNGDAIAPISDDFSAVSKHNLKIADAISSGYDDAASAVNEYTPDENGASTYGWTRTLGYMLGELAGSEVPFDCFDAPYEMFTIEMKVSETAADGTYTIGFDPTSYENCDGYSVDDTTGGLYGTIASDCGYSVENMYEFGTCEITVSSAPAGPSITFEGTQARMADWNNYANATSFDAGIICQLNNKELTFDANYQCNEIDSIMIYLNDSEVGVPCYQVYKVDNSTWKFRLVINNVLKDSEAFATGDFSYRVVITFKDGTAPVDLSTTANFQTILADGIASYEANK